MGISSCKKINGDKLCALKGFQQKKLCHDITAIFCKYFYCHTKLEILHQVFLLTAEVCMPETIMK